MDLITYALLKKQGGSSADINEIKNRLNLLEQEIDEKVAVLDAGLTPVASKKGEVIVNEVTDEVWDRLNNNNADVYAAVDGVVIRATYAVNQDNEVEISEGSRVICTIGEDDGEYSIDWNEYYNDADISLTAVGVIGEALWVKGAGTGAIKTVNASTAVGDYSVAEGYNTSAVGRTAHAEGQATMASGAFSHAEGGQSVASGDYSHAEGIRSTASATSSHAEGYESVASKDYAHAEGYMAVASEYNAHAEGEHTTSAGFASHAEGEFSEARGYTSHAEGNRGVATGFAAHAEGNNTSASGFASHAEGTKTIANASNMHAGGSYNIAASIATSWVKNTSYSVGDIVSFNDYTYRCITANSDSSWNESKWEILRPSDGDTAFVIGNGVDTNNPSNAMHLDWDGNLKLAGDVYANSNSDSTGGVRLVTEVDNYDKAPIILASASGSIASFPDGADDLPVENLIAEIVPKQDLHGYDNPWPAGGGVNKLPAMVDGTYEGNGVKAVVKDGIATFSGTTTKGGNAFIIPLTEAITASDSFYYHCLNSVANGSLAPSIEYSGDTSYAISIALSPINRISGNYTNRGGKIFDRIRFYIASGVTISGTYSPMFCLDDIARSYVPYSNICPITGWDGCEVVRTRKNLLDISNLFTDSSIYTKNADGSLTILSTNSKAWTGSSVDPIPLKAGTYTISRTTISGSLQVRCSLDDYANDLVNIASANSETFTLAEDCFIKIKPNTGSGATYPNTTFLQLELGSTATAYEPYHGSTYPISWQSSAGTVYGGRLNVTTGELVVDRAMADISSLTWSTAVTDTQDIRSMASTSLSNVIKLVPTSGTVANIVCEGYGTISSDSVYSRQTGIAVTRSGALRIYDPDYNLSTSVADFVTARGSLKIVYELATPLTYQLTSVQVKTLLGQNNVWADCGDTEVEYRADTKLWINANATGTQPDLSNYVQKTDYATTSATGVVKVGNGLTVSSGTVSVSPATSAHIKAGTNTTNPITPNRENEATFYGLAKAAGDTTQASSSNAVGTYTTDAKTAIQTMIGVNQWGTGTGTKSIIHAGSGATATGNYAVSEGYATNASGYASHAEGGGTVSGGNYSHAEGFSSESSGAQSHAEGDFTIANGSNMHSEGTCNIGATVNNNWVANTAYAVGDIAVHTEKTYKCITANTDSVWTDSNWEMLYPSTSDTAFIIGNGVNSSNRSNAMKVDWNGNQYLMGDVYVQCDADSTNGKRLAMVGEIGGYVVTISDANPVIDAAANTRYVCGEVATLSFTPPQDGSADIRFTSGSTATVLTLPNTVKMPSWFTVEANKIYEINIMDGVYGVVMSWNV